MPTFLFWNIFKKPIQDEVAQLVKENSVDVVILAESKIEHIDFLSSLDQLNLNNFRPAPLDHPQKKVLIYHRYDKSALRIERDIYTGSIRSLRFPRGKEIIIAAIHFPSKMYNNQENDLKSESIHLRQELEKIEIKRGHSNSLIVGDFNMNPFEKGMVDAEGIHAIMDQKIAKEDKDRKVRGRTYRYFYNPMWSRMGDISPGPPGTYFYRHANQTCFFWNTFDQVVIRPELIPFFKSNHLKVITKIGSKSLLDESERPKKDISDHLPIIFRIEFEDEE